jgi:membrane protein DedA with SNARE-associated domain
VALFLLGGYGFGNLPWVQGHFGWVTLGVIAVSLVPLAAMAVRGRVDAHKRAAAGGGEPLR